MSHNPERVAAGLKAAIHNPNVSEEAKANARERLHEMGTDDERKQPETNRQLGGYKATLTNPNTSQEAKQHAKDVLEGDNTNSDSAFGEGKSEANVLRGYKATLHNPRVSDEAKEHAEEVLKQHGAL